MLDPSWTKSTFCGSGACVEVADTGHKILVRDGKNPDGPHLSFPVGAWDEFIAGVTAGQFDPS